MKGGGKKLLTALLLGVAAYYLARAVAGNWDQVRAHDWAVRPPLLAASVAANVGVMGWGVWVWGRVLRRFGHAPVPLGTLLRVWFLSSLARYIPGKIFQFVAVAQLGAAAGLSGAVLLTSLVVHTGMTLLAAGLLAAWTLVGPLFPALPALPLGLAATAAGLLLVHPRFLNAALGVVPRLLKKGVIRWHGSWADGAALLALSVASWVLAGGAYALLVASLMEVPWRAAPLLSGVNALSFVAGYLSVVTPGGLGVREAAMTELLLVLEVPRPVGALLAMASRLWTIASELLGGALVLLLFRPPAPAAPSPDAVPGSEATPAGESGPAT